jgi:hypothetical protein
VEMYWRPVAQQFVQVEYLDQGKELSNPIPAASRSKKPLTNSQWYWVL